MKRFSALSLAALLATTGAARANNFEDAATAAAANTLCRSDMSSMAEIGVVAIRAMKDTPQHLEFGDILNISRRAIERRTDRAWRATGTQTRRGLVALALRKGWIE